MSDEQLRTALDRAAEGAPRASRLDVDAAVRASRARRVPAQLLVGAAAAVLVIGGGGLALSALPGTGAFTSAADESADAPTAGEADADGGGAEAGGIDRDALPACGAAPSPGGEAGLELVVQATGASTSDGVPVLITLRSVADAPLELRVVSAPTGALARDGRVLGAAGSDGTGATPLTLAPGQERSWTTLVPAISCATGAAIPSVDVDDAELLAAVAVELLDAGGEVVAVTSPPAPVAAP